MFTNERQRGNQRMKTQSTGLQTIMNWIGRILRLDISAFDEIRAEPTATTAAVLVVFVSSLFAGLGSFLWAELPINDISGIGATEMLVKSFILGSIIQTGVWFLWVYFTYQILMRGFGARVEFAELIRTMGFAFVPVAASVFVLLAGLAVPIGVIAFVMAALLTNIAIQRASDSDVSEATIANLIGFGIFAIFMGLFANIMEIAGTGGLAPGIFFFSLD